jgi:urease accessory protein
MPFEQARTGAHWPARLALAFSKRGDATVLARSSHSGPLRIQKALHPEGPRVCHAIVVHPPGGIAGGDALAIDVDVGAGAHTLVTTPGATRWYRTSGMRAQQTVHIAADAGSIVEWLPQESIVFHGARAELLLVASLASDAVFIGIDMLCLGRIASGERFRTGSIATSTRIVRDGQPLWIEQGRVDGGDPLLDSPIGFAGQPVTATLLVAAPGISAKHVDACRTLEPAIGQGAVTLLPGLLVARYLGPACEPGRDWLARCWSLLRLALTGCEPAIPRIWRT